MNRRSFLSLCITALVAPLALLKSKPARNPIADGVINDDFQLVTFSLVHVPPGAMTLVHKRRIVLYVVAVMRKHSPVLLGADIDTELAQEVGGNAVARRVAFDERVLRDLNCLRGVPCIINLCLQMSFSPDKVTAEIKLGWSDRSFTSVRGIATRGEEPTIDVEDRAPQSSGFVVA